MYSDETFISYLLLKFAERSVYSDNFIIAYYIYKMSFKFVILCVFNCSNRLSS